MTVTVQRRVLQAEIDGSGARSGAAEVRQAGRDVEQTFEGVKRSVGGVDETAKEFTNTIRNLVGAVVTIQSARQVVELSDAYRDQNSQLRQVTETEEELLRVREQVLGIANDTRSSIDSNISLYARLTRATEDLGLTEGQRLTITEAINQAGAISGATTIEQAAAVQQLSQALASGTLRGDEFNSVNEQAPRIMEAIADSLGKTRGELRAMAEDGQITSAIIVEAFLEQSAVLEEEFANVELTVGQAFTVLRNQAGEYVGESNAVGRSTEALAGGLLVLAENLDLVEDAFIALTAGAMVRGAANIVTTRIATTGLTAAMSGLFASMKAIETTTILGVITGIGIGAIKLAEGFATARLESDALRQNLDLLSESQLTQELSEMRDELDRNAAAIQRMAESGRGGSGALFALRQEQEELQSAYDQGIERLSLLIAQQDRQAQTAEGVAQATREEREALERSTEAKKAEIEALKRQETALRALQRYLEQNRRLYGGYADSVAALATEEARLRLQLDGNAAELDAYNRELEIHALLSSQSAGLTEEHRQALIDQLQVVQDLRAAVNEKNAAEEESLKTVGRMIEQADPFADAFVNALSRIDESFADAWSGAFDSFEDFADRIKDALANLLGELANLLITRPLIIQPILGAVNGLTGGALSAAAGGPLAAGLGGGAAALLGGGSGALGSLLFGSPLTGPGFAAATTGGLFSGFSGFATGGLAGGFGSLGSALTGGLGALGFLGAAAPIALAIGALTGGFDDFGESNTRIQIANGLALSAGDSGADPRFFRQTGLGIGVQGERITEVTDGGAIIDAVADLYDQLALIFDATGTDTELARIGLGANAPGGTRTREFVNEDPQVILQELFGDAISELDPAVIAFVEALGGTLDEQLQNLARGLTLQNVFEETGLINDFATLEDAFFRFQEFQGTGEQLEQTIDRVLGGMSTLDFAFDLLGQDFDLLGAAGLQLSADFTEAAGGLDRAGALVQDFFNQYLTPAEQAEFQRDLARQTAVTELAEIGVDINGLTMDELEMMFRANLPELTGDELANWFEALSAFAAYVQTLPEVVGQAILSGPGAGDFRPVGAPFFGEGGGTFGATLGLPGTLFGPGSGSPDLSARGIAQLTVSGQRLASGLYGSPLEQIEEEIANLQQVAQSSIVGAAFAQQRLPGLEAEREAAAAEAERAGRFLQAGDLADVLADLSTAQGRSFDDVADALGFSIEDLAGDLGLSADETRDFLEGLANDSYTLDDLGGTLDSVITEKVTQPLNDLGAKLDRVAVALEGAGLSQASSDLAAASKSLSNLGRGSGMSRRRLNTAGA